MELDDLIGDLDVEGPFIGYRVHEAGRAPAPAFWFGRGLGYGTWDHESADLREDGPPSVVVRLRNIGSMRSREVVQVYLKPVGEDQPVRFGGLGIRGGRRGRHRGGRRDL